jgi:nucleotide-binding universal stress UspA family protein
MSFKRLLTHVVDDPGCAARLRMTAAVARSLGADVIGLGAQPPWPYLPQSDHGGEAYERILEQTKRDIDSAAARFRDLFGGPAAPGAWRAEVGYPGDVIPRHARAADMIVAYRSAGDADRTLYAQPDSLVMEAGVPVLLLPDTEAEFSADTVLLAWKNTREARRAISVTLPVLAAANRVLVAGIFEPHEEDQIGEELADVRQRLERHGVKAHTLAEPAAPGGAGGQLLEIADADDSNLVAAGAYGHSRLREWVLGGVTRDLIADRGRYVLLSH